MFNKVLTPFVSYFCSAVLSLCFIVFPLSAHAENQPQNFHTDWFLKSSESARTWWYMGAFSLMGFIVSQSDEKRGACILDWYFKEPQKKEKILLKAMKDNPRFPPPAIITGLLFKDCGKFSLHAGG